ncbi:hypothetical protein OYC64_021313 [Pagothenia borchgrevinki]|uniref:Sushi domain-containing protein n=1 Tax=Pagothenia borchgrevinki TaxID=8213 RepID=A0ABD2FZL9_PAGBO
MQLSVILLLLQLWGSVEVTLSQNACPKVPHIPNADVVDETKKAEYQLGDVIHFACETGYISGPTIRYACTSEGWLALRQGRCYLKPCELPDDTPNGFYQIIHGEELVFGTKIKYFCNEGYQMVSKDDTRTCFLDNWTNHLPICEPLSCELPPANEGLMVKGIPENDDLILPDRFLEFRCDGPWKNLNGSSMLICLKDGQWDNAFPTCEDITCKVEELSLHLTVAGLPTANKTVKVGRKLQFHCEDEYGLDGSEEITCLENGQWNAPFPTCAEKCKVTGVSDTVRFSTDRQVKRLTFSCHKNGDTLLGNAEVTCLANGQWSAPFPTCGAPSGCGKPTPLEDGDIEGTVGHEYRNGAKVKYICPNFYIMQGGPHKTCTNGQWVGQMRCLKPCTVNRHDMTTHNIGFKYSTYDKIYSEHDDIIGFRCTRGRHDGALNMRQKCIDGVMLLPTCH